MTDIVHGQNADYVITYLTGHGHSTSDRSFLNAKPNAIVSEIPTRPLDPRTKGINDPDYPTTEDAISVLRNAGWFEIQRAQVPVVVLDPRLMPEEKFGELLIQQQKRETNAKKMRWASVISLLAATGLAIRQTQKEKKLKTKKRSVLPSRRRFLRDTAGLFLVTGGLLGAAELYEPKHLKRTGPLHSTWIEEGRSAWWIDYCENHLAPYLRRTATNGKKPLIALLPGNLHSEVEQYIQNPVERRRILQKYAPEFRQVAPKFRDNLYIFRIDESGRVKREVIPIKRPQPATQPSAARFSRRELFKRLVRRPFRHARKA